MKDRVRKGCKEHFETEFVQGHLQRALDEQTAWMRGILNSWVPRLELQSPLEAAFAIWWEVVANLRGVDGLGLSPQHQVEINGHKYRFDFIVVRTGVVPIYEPLDALKIAVELDGHGFHERPREQVTARDRRDRDCAQAGWLVLHFSWGEFNRDPVRCVEDTYKASWRR